MKIDKSKFNSCVAMSSAFVAFLLSPNFLFPVRFLIRRRDTLQTQTLAAASAAYTSTHTTTHIITLVKRSTQSRTYKQRKNPLSQSGESRPQCVHRRGEAFTTPFRLAFKTLPCALPWLWWLSVRHCKRTNSLTDS